MLNDWCFGGAAFSRGEDIAKEIRSSAAPNLCTTIILREGEDIAHGWLYGSCGQRPHIYEDACDSDLETRHALLGFQTWQAMVIVGIRDLELCEAELGTLCIRRFFQCTTSLLLVVLERNDLYGRRVVERGHAAGKSLASL